MKMMRDVIDQLRGRLATSLYWAAETVEPPKSCDPPPCPSLRAVRLDDGTERPLPPIPDSFRAMWTCRPDCLRCDGVGAVCEQHPDRPFPDQGVTPPPPFPCDCGHLIGVPCDPANREMQDGRTPKVANLTIEPCNPEDTNHDRQ